MPKTQKLFLNDPEENSLNVFFTSK